jgi:Protein of unknown function (DUF3443)
MRPRVAVGTIGRLLALVGVGVMLAGCGGGSGGGTGNNVQPPVSNTQAVAVNLGPANNVVNVLFVSVTVCVPGSTTNCQTIPNIQVDTGSEGLRLLSSTVTLSFPAITDSSSNVLQECVAFADGSYLWGPVGTADIQMAGEKALSVPVQVADAPGTGFNVPSDCASGGGPNIGTLAALGANGILGLGVFQQDCGSACAGAASTVPAVYYLCPNSVCQAASVPLGSQLSNPVWLFPQDNNGFLISLPTVPDTGAQTVSGSLIFGIGTQSNNALGSAKIYTTDGNGNFPVSYNGISYSQSFIDSGSNGLFFLDSTTAAIPDCADNPGFYCPASTTPFAATTTGLNGNSTSVSFNIANADALFAANNASNSAFSNLGGDNPGSFDFGLPFFFGRTVFIGIEGFTAPNGAVGPYWAY